MNKNRIEAFSDGVLAIIITIMVLEIKVPHGSSEWIVLKPLIPVFISYLMSFLFIGIYWANHHHLLHAVEHVSSGMIWANLNLLFWLSLVPFTTGWMGENHFAPNTVVLYGTILLISAISSIILLKTIEKNTHDVAAFKKAFLKLNKKGMFSLIGYLLAIPIAYIVPIVSQAIFFAISIVWLIPGRNIERALKKIT
jgi:uncharacterized membrane protein